MSKFSVQFSTSGDAFAEEPGEEIARILRIVADHYEVHGANSKGARALFRTRDINGNRVGFAVHEEEGETP